MICEERERKRNRMLGTDAGGTSGEIYRLKKEIVDAMVN